MGGYDPEPIKTYGAIHAVLVMLRRCRVGCMLLGAAPSVSDVCQSYRTSGRSDWDGHSVVSLKQIREQGSSTWLRLGRVFAKSSVWLQAIGDVDGVCHLMLWTASFLR